MQRMRLVGPYAFPLILLLVLLGVAIFFLPFAIPSHTAVLSPSADYHFNNIVSVISIWIGFCLLAAVLHRMIPGIAQIGNSTPPSLEIRSSAMGFGHLLLWVLVYAAVTGILYAIGANYRYSEGDYFLLRIDRLGMGQRPYRDFEYAYGVLFIYLPYWINRLAGFSASYTGYSISLLLTGTLGLLSLFRLLDSFPISKRKKLIIFYGLAACFIPYPNGQNYSILRFVAPLVSIWLLHRTWNHPFREEKGRIMRWVIVASLLTICNGLISLEMGLTLCLAIALFLLGSWIAKRQPAWLLGLFVFAGICVLFYLAIGGSAIWTTPRSFGAGAMNWVVIPSPSILIYLGAFFLFNFFLLERIWQKAGPPGPALPILLLVDLLMVSPCFGRCDPFHLLFNGLGSLMGTWLMLAWSSKRGFRVYTVLFYGIFVLGMNFSGLVSYKESIGMAIANRFGKNPRVVKGIERLANWLDKREGEKIDSYIEKREGNVDTGLLAPYPHIALPFYVDKDIYLYLLHAGKYVPEFYTDLLNVGTQSQIEDKLRTMRNPDHRVMILQEKYFALQRLYSQSDPDERKYISLLFLCPFPYSKWSDSRTLIDPIYRFILSSYRAVGRVKGGYVLAVRAD